jgi:hypothetical protein
MRNHRYANGTLAILAGLASYPAVAAPAREGAPCKLGAFWQITHANGTFAQARIDQAGAHFSGSVAAPASKTAGRLYEGRIRGRNLSFRVRWASGHSGAYRGYVRADGHVEGSNYDLAIPGARQLWVLKQRIEC